MWVRHNYRPLGGLIMFKNIALRAVLIAVAIVIGQAYAANTKSIDIPAGDLAVALEMLARQSGVEFVYEVQQLKGLRTKGVHGVLTPENAVAKLLEGTALTVTKHVSGAVLISAPSAVSLNRKGSLETEELFPAQNE